MAEPTVPAASSAGAVELVHQPPVGLAGRREFLVAFFQHSAKFQDGLALGLELGVDGGGAGRGTEAAAGEGLLADATGHAWRVITRCITRSWLGWLAKRGTWALAAGRVHVDLWAAAQLDAEGCPGRRGRCRHRCPGAAVRSALRVDEGLRRRRCRPGRGCRPSEATRGPQGGAEGGDPAHPGHGGGPGCLPSRPGRAGPGGGVAAAERPLLPRAVGGRLRQGHLRELVRLLARTAGVGAWEQLSPHSLRHSAITFDAGCLAARRAGLYRPQRSPARPAGTTTPATAWTATPPMPSPTRTRPFRIAPSPGPPLRGRPGQSLIPA